MNRPRVPVVVATRVSERASRYAGWLPEYEVATVSSLDCLKRRLEDDAGVVVLDDGFGAKSTSAVVSGIQSNGLKQQVIVTTDDPVRWSHSDRPDETLVRPLDAAELSDAVDRACGRFVYTSLLQSHYVAALQAAARREREGTETLVDSEEYARTTQRLERLRSEINEAAELLGNYDWTRVLERITDTERREVAPGNDSQYDWTVESERSEECVCSDGFGSSPPPVDDPNWKKLASYVWKCTSCGRIERRTRPSTTQMIHHQ